MGVMNLEELLEAHTQMEFPAACGGRVIGEVDLLLLNAEVMELAHLYQSTRNLDAPSSKRLHLCRDKFEEVLQILRGEEYDYFVHLRMMLGCIAVNIFKAENPDANPNDIKEERPKQIYWRSLSSAACKTANSK